jgi:ribonuclease HI
MPREVRKERRGMRLKSFLRNEEICFINSYSQSKGNQENTFKWGLGRTSNNQAEALALFQGLRIINEKHIKKTYCNRGLGFNHQTDAKRLIPSDGNLIRTIKRIRKEVIWFESVEFFHILRSLNHQADHLANKAILLDWKIKIKKWGGILPIP